MKKADKKKKKVLKKKKMVTPEEIKANIGLLGMKGKMLRSLMDEKKREREL